MILVVVYAVTIDRRSTALVRFSTLCQDLVEDQDGGVDVELPVVLLG